MSQRILIMEGPDRCGKTEIGKRLGREITTTQTMGGLSSTKRLKYGPYFKVSTESANWRESGGFLNALKYDQTYITEFLQQTRCSCIIDRAYPSEIVYSGVFGRNTDMQLAWEIDRRFADMGSVIVLCTRRDIPTDWDDELVDDSKFHELSARYDWFMYRTKCSVVKIVVDDFGCDLEKQIPVLMPAIDFCCDNKGAKVIL